MIANLPSPPPSPDLAASLSKTSRPPQGSGKTACASNAAYNKSLLSSGTFADCTIYSGHRVWHAHRNILGPRCRFFSVCFDGRFRESSAPPSSSPSCSPSSTSSATVAQIRLDDDHPEAVAGLLEYLYTLEYPVPAGFDEEEGSVDFSSWLRDFRMHAIADKYAVPGLMGLARSALLSSAKDPELRRSEVFVKQLPQFCDLVEALYASDADSAPSDAAQELRIEVLSVLAETVARHVRDERLVELMGGVPELAVDLVDALARRAREREMEVEMGVPGLGYGMGGMEVEKRRMVHIPLNEDSDSEYD